MPFSGNDLDGNPNMKRYLFVFIIHWLSLHFPNTSQIIMKTLYLMMCMFTESRIEFSWRSPFYFLVMNCLCATACASVVKFWEIFLRPNKVRLESFATLQCKMVKTIHQEAKKNQLLASLPARRRASFNCVLCLSQKVLLSLVGTCLSFKLSNFFHLRSLIKY